MKKSYIVCILAAMLCSASMASAPVASVGMSSKPNSGSVNGGAGFCNYWFTCAIRRLACVNGKYLETPMQNGQSLWTCIAD